MLMTRTVHDRKTRIWALRADKKNYSREMVEAARRGLVVPSPEPLNDTDSDDIPHSAQKERSHDSDSMSDNEALNMMHHPDSGELPDLASSGDEEEDGPSLRAQLRREIKQPTAQPKFQFTSC
jgi:hypothetical protein